MKHRISPAVLRLDRTPTRRLGAFFAICLFGATSVSAQVAVNDLFNRPNGGLGPDWLQIDGSAAISNGGIQGTNPWIFGWSAHTAYGAGYQATVVRADWAIGSPGARVSVIAGVDPNTWQGIEVRIADNTGNSLADRIFFNAAVNAGNWYGGSLFFNLANPLASGQVTLWFTNGGDTANVEIKDHATGATETFSAGGILALPPSGTTVGIGYFGTGMADDFRAWTGAPTGPSFTATAPRIGAPLDLLVTDATANSLVYIGYSLAGNGPTPTPLGNIALSLPYELLGNMPWPADNTGRVHILVQPLPPAFLGLPIHLQALDLAAASLSNAFTATLF